MNADAETLRAYSGSVEDYVRMCDDLSNDPLLDTFIGGVSKGGRVLDLGCGPGWAAAQMAAAGLRVDATDATPEMIELAAQRDGVNARLATFDDIAGTDVYDGIWANFSLLHAPRADMPRHLSALRKALKSGGLLHIALKTGTGEHRDRLGRRYTYYTQDELYGLLRDAGFTPFSSHAGCDVGLEGTPANWVAMAAHG